MAVLGSNSNSGNMEMNCSQKERLCVCETIGLNGIRKRQFVHKLIVHDFSDPLPPSHQQYDGSPRELMLKGPQAELRIH